MKKLFLTASVFLLISLFSSAQKMSLNSIKVKAFRVSYGDTDTTFNIFNVDAQGYKQGAFQLIYQNRIVVKGNYKNDILVDSCFWYNKEGDLFVKGNFIYKNDYSRTIDFGMMDHSRNYFAYLDDTIIVYNNPNNRSIPSVLVYKNNLKHGEFKINSKEGFENIFTYNQDTLHGYFKNTFIPNPRKYNQKVFFEKGNYWNGPNSYDGWYYKHIFDEDENLILIQKTQYNKNIKLESSTFYSTSGKKECVYYYSKVGIIDSIRCVHEEGNLKSIIHYNSNQEGIQYTYDVEGELIKKAPYIKERLNGYVLEYSNNVLEQKTLYKNDTLITKEVLTNKNIVWQRVFYKNNEVEKVDWFTNSGKYTHTTCCESFSTGDGNSAKNLYIGPNGNVPGNIYQKEKTIAKESSVEKTVDFLFYKPFPIGHKYYSENSFNYSNKFTISERKNNSFKPNEYYKNVLNRIQDSLMAYVKTEEGKALTKLKDPITITISLSLLESDAANGFTSVHLNKITDGKNKKINKAIEKFFINRTIPYSFSFAYFENQYVECSYTIYPD